MAKLSWMDPRQGHATLEYDTQVHDEVKAAEKRFNELLAEHMPGGATIDRRAYAVTLDKKGKKVAEPMPTFDPKAEEILVVSPMMGG